MALVSGRCGGLYEFSEDRFEINIDTVVAMMEEILDATVENEADQTVSKKSGSHWFR